MVLYAKKLGDILFLIFFIINFALNKTYSEKIAFQRLKIELRQYDNFRFVYYY